MVVLLLALLLLLVTVLCQHHEHHHEQHHKQHYVATSIRKASKAVWIEDVIVFRNNLISDSITICLIDNYNSNNGFCIVLNDNDEEWMKTYIGSKWTINRQSSNETYELEIVGGKHEYNIDDNYFIKASNEYISNLKKEKKIIIIKTPDYCDEKYTSWDVLGPTWRDGLRSALYRRNYEAACICGEHNVSSTFTVESPSSEVPFILSSTYCDCGNKQHPFHFYLPCTYGIMDPNQLAEHSPCSNDDNSFDIVGVRKSNVRIFMLHMTTFVDFISMKNKLYKILRESYGGENATFIMPRTYEFSYGSDFSKLIERCESQKDKDEFYIFKNPGQHRQLGTTLVSSSLFLKQKSFYQNSDINMATIYIPDPYLIRGHKINIRRYLLVVCTGNELLGYVHESGKNIYTKKPYREPWTGKQFDFETTSGLFDLATRQEETITTGYVPPDFYDDKPLSGIEFIEWVKVVGNKSADLLWETMATRLALVLNANGPSAGDNNLCNTNHKKTETEEIPSCLKDSVRFQVFGCDFHIDSKLTGKESRLFECNKGPDMSVHSLKDGSLKRSVAADIFTFIDFANEFDGSEENASQNNIHLIYNSSTFDAIAALTSLM